jgi:hypothetical protein
MALLKVVTCTKTKYDNYLVKSTTAGEAGPAVFGSKLAGGQATYYMFLEGTVAVGTEAEVDLELFNIDVQEFIPEDAKPGDSPIKLKYLKPLS